MTPPRTLFTGLYIDGRWERGSGELPVLDPTDGSVLAGAATASIDECVTAVDAATAAQPAWAAASPTQRAEEVLRDCFTLMIDERDTFAELIQAENGKAWNEAIAEVNYAAEFFRWFSEEAPRIGGEFRRAPNGDKASAWLWALALMPPGVLDNTMFDAAVSTTMTTSRGHEAADT